MPAAVQDRVRSTSAALENQSKDACIEAAPKVSTKKLQRAAGVAQDLALKCRMAKARRDLLLRMAQDLGHNAFSEHVERVSIEVSSETLELQELREAIEARTSLLCCASWAPEARQTLHLYLRSKDEADRITTFIESGELGKVIEATLHLQVNVLETKQLKSAILKTPVGLQSLGFQSHGLQGTVLNIDWVHPDQWAHAFGVKMDDLIIFINGRPTSELAIADVLQMSQTTGLQLLLAREA